MLTRHLELRCEARQEVWETVYGPPFQPDGAWYRGQCPAAFADRTLMGTPHSHGRFCSRLLH